MGIFGLGMLLYYALILWPSAFTRNVLTIDASNFAIYFGGGIVTIIFSTILVKFGMYKDKIEILHQLANSNK